MTEAMTRDNGNDHIHLTTNIIWQIWKVRNKTCFEGAQADVKRFLDKALREWMEYDEASSRIKLCGSGQFHIFFKNFIDMSISCYGSESCGDALFHKNHEDGNQHSYVNDEIVDDTNGSIDKIDELEIKESVRDEHEVYTLYCQYVHAKGFSVRKRKTNFYVGTNIVMTKSFLCSKERAKDNKRHMTTWKQLDTRTCCKALIWWQISEGDEDFCCSEGIPILVIQTSDILKHIASYYTYKMYKLFEEEFTQDVGAVDLRGELKCGDSLYRYEIELHGKKKRGLVMFDVHSLEIKCSCCLFETTSILCSDALKVLSLKNGHFILEKYLLKRWCKDAR
ncbi:hypothetical protein ACH5RR_031789 [Cinchona calisaya]|uniref:Protein FAR1-RELATED SEQUENCE n=1 Tax=Cinchona calisaya TaxID=153742 RepID=A0ABD2YJ96_9GENT